MRRFVRALARACGYDVVRHVPPVEAAVPPGGGTGLPPDVQECDRAVLERVAGFTMTGVDRQLALVQAVRYAVRRGIHGSFVECGVWRGGSTMAVALTLLQEGETDRDLFLFDTFEGMSPPTDADATAAGVPARTLLAQQLRGTGDWCFADMDDVRTNMLSTGYPPHRVHLVKGPVERTIPASAPPAPIALLRLDTDWYESTLHELTHLFPLLRDGGILIVDDYGHWQGARRAVDEYLATRSTAYLLQRIDYTGRLLLKQ